jgi:hypothetical protein
MAPWKHMALAMVSCLSVAACRDRASTAPPEQRIECEAAARRLALGWERLGLQPSDWANQCRSMAARCDAAGFTGPARALRELTVEH